jgi:hypothetical protein
MELNILETVETIFNTIDDKYYEKEITDLYQMITGFYFYFP